MGKTSLKKKILLGMASALDEAGEWIEALENPYRWREIGAYKKQTIYNTVSELLKAGFIEKRVNKNGEPVFRITSQGKTKIAYDVPLVRLMGKKWDGIWRLVSFDIPEKKAKLRVRLREKLKELGFGMLQESLWIIPHDLGQVLAEFLNHENLKDYTIVWEGKRMFGEDERELANRVWHLDDLHWRYLDFISKFSEILRKKEEIKKRKEEWEEAYFSLLAQDPGLPPELLPEDWLFEKARQLFKKLRNSL